MYAVFRTGGKQYRVSPGQRLRVEKLDAAVGESVAFNEVLLVGEGANLELGSPLVDGGRVEGTITEQGRARKIEVVKFKRRAHYMRRKGHRQHYTEILVTEVAGGSAGSQKYAGATTKPDAGTAAPDQDSTED